MVGSSKRLVYAAFIAMSAILAQANDYMLYWQVLDTATVDGISLNDYESAYAQEHNNFDIGGSSGKIAGARAVMLDDSYSGGPVVMNIAEYTAGHWSITEYTDTYICGNDEMQIAGTGGGMYSHFVADDPTQLAFAIELGNWESGEWVTLATSGSMSYSDLVLTTQDGVHILQAIDNINLNNFQPWSPAVFSVPEPSSLVLSLLGAAALSLKRKKGISKS